LPLIVARFLRLGTNRSADDSRASRRDTTHCPNFVRGRVYKLSGPHLGGHTVSDYISVYEVEAPSYAEAERVLNEWQADPNAWSGRQRHLETGASMGEIPLKVKGSGWYELLRSFDGPAKPG